MKLFSCHLCHQIVFFENVRCTRCGHALAYLPDRAIMSAVEEEPSFDNAGVPTSGGQTWRALAPGAEGARYRLCRNSAEHGVCNWAIPAAEPNEYCPSCRLNHIIPNLADPQAKVSWHRMEIAKRRLLYTLLGLGLPVETKEENPAGGLAFDFLQDDHSEAAPKVMTGHRGGLVTINIAEADDPFREKMRVQMGEVYRTVLGHFRHEIGHYYWDRLIKGSPTHEAFRARFGDEQQDYDAAVKRHYDEGPPADWSANFVSAYASMHPWEDWAETWAHYLHMVDTLETARAYGLSLRPAAAGPPAAAPSLTARRLDLRSFDDLMTGWIPLTTALNSLNRSMGTNDCYPFVLSDVAIEKLRFVHEVIERAGEAGRS